MTENKSPDIPFRFSVNPYRGCLHGCSYCYARPYHEFVGLNAGLDFETKILVKHDAPELFRDFLARKNWDPQLIAFSGITDCYQPCEREFQLTRQCLEIAATYKQPIGIITKNALVVRDLDLLAAMAKQKLVSVNISLITLDVELSREMEPRTSTPAARLRAISELSAAGIPTQVMVAPVIPGLTDSEIPAVLGAAKEAGAYSAGFGLLRLPMTVKPVFLEWLSRTQGDRATRVQQRIRQTRDGQLDQSEFGKRMLGTGEIAKQIRSVFQVFAKKYGLDHCLPQLRYDLFKSPPDSSRQMKLF